MDIFTIQEEAYKRGYEAGYADGEIDFAPKWIPVTKRLPKLESYVYSVDVLFYVPYENIYVGYVNLESGTWKCKHSRNLFAADKVTHWMPLPEPPKGE